MGRGKEQDGRRVSRKRQPHKHKGEAGPSSPRLCISSMASSEKPPPAIMLSKSAAAEQGRATEQVNQGKLRTGSACQSAQQQGQSKSRTQAHLSGRMLRQRVS